MYYQKEHNQKISTKNTEMIKTA